MQIFHRFIIDALIKVLCGKNWIQVFDKFAVPFQSVHRKCVCFSQLYISFSFLHLLLIFTCLGKIGCIFRFGI